MLVIKHKWIQARMPFAITVVGFTSSLRLSSNTVSYTKLVLIYFISYYNQHNNGCFFYLIFNLKDLKNYIFLFDSFTYVYKTP